MAKTTKPKKEKAPKKIAPKKVKETKKTVTKKAEPKKTKVAKETSPKKPVKLTKKLRVCIALLSVVVITGGVMGGLWLGGVFDDKGIKDTAVSFISTLDSMEVKQTEGRDLAATYQDKEGRLHLLYKTGSLGSMFIELLTTPEKRTELNGGGEISFTSGKIESKAITDGITRSTTTSTEHSAGGSLTLTVGYGMGGAGWGGSVAVEAHYDYTSSKSSTFESSRYTEVGSEISVEETHTVPLSECTVGYYYAYAAYANFDVFLDVCVVKEGNDFKVVSAAPYYAMTSSRPSIVFVASATDDFDVPVDYGKKLEFIDSIDVDDIFIVGDGSANNPYEIYSAAQLLSICLFPDKNYKVVNDTDLGVDLRGWQWANDITFSGTLDGNNKTIRNLTIDVKPGPMSEHKRYGLFANVSTSGVIKDLIMVDCKISRPKTVDELKEDKVRFDDHDGNGFFNAGIIAGYAKGTFTNITVRNSTVSSYRYNSDIGGFFGVLEYPGKMNNCRAEGVKVQGNGNMGVLCGYMLGSTIDSCTVTSFGGNVMPTVEYELHTVDRSVGGMVGRGHALSIIFRPMIKNSEVANLTFKFSRENDDYTAPPVGYVAGDYEGEINNVKIPSGITIDSLGKLFAGFDYARNSYYIRYFFGAGSYYDGDWIGHSWGWGFDYDNTSENLSLTRPIEIGYRRGNWKIVKTNGTEFIHG